MKAGFILTFIGTSTRRLLLANSPIQPVQPQGRGKGEYVIEDTPKNLAETVRVERRPLWHDLRALNSSTIGSWLIHGAFNIPLQSEDRMNRALVHYSETIDFQQCLDDIVKSTGKADRWDAKENVISRNQYPTAERRIEVDPRRPQCLSFQPTANTGRKSLDATN
ncbi:hypothetical protein HAX54_019609 [Datura stramonium]|uniref:Uncharacterized protein n=1 Tax=Datura stramonium TaxID=4076 RepID=A0ABS8URI5_DATST|nr:hypothetical protein [Datura stramonium]